MSAKAVLLPKRVKIWVLAGRYAEIDFLGFVIPYGIRNYVREFWQGLELLTCFKGLRQFYGQFDQ